MLPGAACRRTPIVAMLTGALLSQAGLAATPLPASGLAPPRAQKSQISFLPRNRQPSPSPTCAPGARPSNGLRTKDYNQCGELSDWNIARLMKLLARSKGGRTTFTETKHMAVLDKPLLSSGELVYKPPDYLEKRTLKPTRETFVLDHNALTVVRHEKKYSLRLQDYPRVAALTAGILGTLSGNRAALQRSYKLQLRGPPTQWTLTLSPTDSHIASIIRDIIFHGKQGQVLSIVIHQPDGDYSVMTIAPPHAP